MKKILLGLALMLALGSQAQAAWQCKANVNGTIYGWNGGIFYSNYDARLSAIDVCNYNSGKYCHIQSCWQVW